MTQYLEDHLSHLGFQLIEPSPILKHLVSCYWIIDNAENGSEHMELWHPDGGSGVVFHFGEQLIIDQQEWSRGAIFNGVNTHTNRLKLSGAISAVGIRFHPGGAAAFWPQAQAELKDTHLLLADLGGAEWSGLYHRLAEAVTAVEKVRLIERWLLQMLRPEFSPAAEMEKILRMIRSSHGVVSMMQLSARSGMSQRTLERRFNVQLGITPKEYANAIRARTARQQLKVGCHSNVDLAQLLGYSDQAHFIRQFKSVVGMTPGCYQRRSLANRT